MDIALLISLERCCSAYEMLTRVDMNRCEARAAVVECAGAMVLARGYHFPRRLCVVVGSARDAIAWALDIFAMLLLSSLAKIGDDGEAQQDVNGCC